MGAAVSSNTAQAIADVSNSIQNSTTASSDNIAAQGNYIRTNHCDIEVQGDINIKQTATIAATNKQFAQGMSNSDVKNNIQQKMMQEAMSTVGSMGIGYANASNSASMFSSSTNDVVNTVKTLSTQISNAFNSVTCTDSIIRARNINISQGLSANFLSEQIVKSNNITKISNTISQVAQQKATAKVAGLAGFIIALAVLIIAIGWSFAKAASAGGIIKMVVAIGVIILLGIITGVMYLYKAPPFFNDSEICSMSFSYGTGDNKCTDCVNTKSQELPLEQTPMKYLFSLTGDPPQDSGLTGSLLEMIVMAKSTSDQMKINQGYNGKNANTINKIAKEHFSDLPESVKNEMMMKTGSFTLGPPDIFTIPTDSSNKYYFKIPDEYTPDGGDCTPGFIQINPGAPPAPSSFKTSCPSKVSSTSPTQDISSAISTLNVVQWDEYIKEVSPQFARFFLLRLLESPKVRFDLTTYEDEKGNEPVVYMDGYDEKVDLAKNLGDKAYKYRNHTGSQPSTQGKSGSGTVKGLFGVCNNQQYKLRKFSRTWGIGIIILILLLLGGILLYTSIKSKKIKI